MLKLTPQEREEIRQMHRSCRERKYADKLKALLLLDKGFSCVDVGEMLLLDDDTIRKYREQYLNLGAESLLQDNNRGRASYLNSKQLELLNQELESNTYADSKGIIVWISLLPQASRFWFLLFFKSSINLLNLFHYKDLLHYYISNFYLPQAGRLRPRSF